MDKVRRRGLTAMGVLAVAGAAALGLAAWFLWWFFTEVAVIRGA